MLTEKQKKQYGMHKDFFDRCQFAIDNGMYFEAMLMEYAAIEARLEVIMGVLGLPCNKNIPDKERRKVNISDRVRCLKTIQKGCDVFNSSKLPDGFFGGLEKWIEKRNRYIHGLYKNEMEYTRRMNKIEEVADKGFVICKSLYDEAKRLRKLCHDNALPEVIDPCIKNSCNIQKQIPAGDSQY